MEINKELLKIITCRADIVATDREGEIRKSCFFAAMDGSDFQSFSYDEKNIKEIKELEEIAEKLKDSGFKIDFDGDPGHMYMSVSWY